MKNPIFMLHLAQSEYGHVLAWIAAQKSFGIMQKMAFTTKLHAIQTPFYSSRRHCSGSATLFSTSRHHQHLRNDRQNVVTVKAQTVQVQKAVVINETGESSVLQVSEWPYPTRKAGELQQNRSILKLLFHVLEKNKAYLPSNGFQPVAALKSMHVHFLLSNRVKFIACNLKLMV